MKWQDRLIALLVAAVWGFNFVVIKWGVSGIPPFTLGGLRFSAVVALAIFFVRRPAIPWRWLAAYGLSVGFIQFACLFTAIKLACRPGFRPSCCSPRRSSRCSSRCSGRKSASTAGSSRGSSSVGAGSG